MTSPSVRFKNKELFGNTFAAHQTKALGHVFDMALAGKIAPDGRVSGGNLSQLWSYVYILYLNNKRYDVFDEMRGRRGALQAKGTAKRFVRAVAKHQRVDRVDEAALRRFINEVVETREPKNPVAELLRNRDFKSIRLASSNATEKASRSAKPDASEKIIEELLKATGARDAAGAVEKAKAYMDRARLLEDENKELEKLRAFAKQQASLKTGDVTEIIAALRRRLERPSEAPALAECPKDAEAFKIELRTAIETLTLARMCALKTIGQIVGSPMPSVPCDTGDTSRQSELFERLPEGKKAEYASAYKSIRDEIISTRDLWNALSMSCLDCNRIAAARAEFESQKKNLEKLAERLANLSEDLLGSCRVFVKMRPFVEDLDDNERARDVRATLDGTTATLECAGATLSARFFGAYGEAFSNADLYAGALGAQSRGLKLLGESKPLSLHRTFAQLKAGYSICMMANGYSGSGKTHMFFGDERRPGLVQYALANVGAFPISVEYAFELYYDSINVNERDVSAKIIALYDRPRDLAQKLKSYGVESFETDPVALRADVARNEPELEALVDDSISSFWQKQRKSGRIKRTLNNDSSSRSHLFVVFRVAGAYLTVADLAGNENPFSIYNALFKGDKKTTLPYFLLQFDSEGKYRGGVKGERIETYLGGHGVANGSAELKKNDENKLVFKLGHKPRIEETLAKNVQVLLEGFVINETLLHMRWFLNDRMGRRPKFEPLRVVRGTVDYKTTSVFVSPESEASPHGTKKICMIPVLKFIEDLGARDTVAKFLLFGALRPDRCQDNMDTLRYLASVSGA